MRMLVKLRLAGGIYARARMRREAARFLAATADCRKTQHEVLHRLLALNGDSRFSQKHGFGEVRNVADFRQRMPIADYEYFRPHIERLKLGDHRALLGERNRLLMFSLSSGTTAESKFIPITQQFLSDYRRGWQCWGILAFDDHHQLHARNVVQLTSDYDRFRTPGGTPCGNISGLVGAMQKPIVRIMYSVPLTVSKISDPEAKNYTSLRLALADGNVGLVMTANPSTLVHLAKFADSAKEELIRDIADGTLSRRYLVSDEIRDKLKWRIARRRTARARFLEQVVERTGHFYPSDYWPKLEVVGVWCGGSVGVYLHSLRRFYDDVTIRDHGLHASEGRMTIPLADERSEGVLESTTHFFEFIPEEERDADNPTVLEAHELEEGRNYFILLTTSSGLYRYDICDVVRCNGFQGTTPILEFLHKGSHISSITGEKVSESQVVNAVRSCVERRQLHLKHFTITPVFGDPPRYQLLVERRDLVSPLMAENLVQEIDECLQQLNCEYGEKRASGRLAPMTCIPLPDGVWGRFIQNRQSRLGGSAEQYKHPCLVPDIDFSAKFLSEYAPNNSAAYESSLSKTSLSDRGIASSLESAEASSPSGGAASKAS